MSVFFTSWKIAFKSWLDTSSIASYLSSFLSFFLSQSRLHLDTWWTDRDWVCMPDSFSIPGGSIELLFLILMCCSLTPQLSMSIFSTPPRQIPRYLSTPASVEIYWLHYIRPLRDPVLISIDLSLDTSLFSLPKHSHLTPNLFLKDSSSFFKFLFTW